MMRFVTLTSTLMDTIEYNFPILSFESLVWSGCGGLILGALGSYFTRRDVGALVDKLVRDGIDSPARAITLAEAGFAKNIPVRLALRTGKPLRRMISCANEDTFETKKHGPIRRFFTGEAEHVQTDLTTARFYLTEEMKYRAQTRYDTKGITPLHLLLSVALLIAAAAVALYAAPRLISLLDSFLTSIES